MRNVKRVLVTGGAGFVGSAFINYLFKHTSIEKVVNLDLLKLGANLKSLSSIESDARYRFVYGDILDAALVRTLIQEEQIETIVHFAADSRVDCTVEDPLPFYRTNVSGTIALLEIVRQFPHLHFHHVSTDEVYGSIAEGYFKEDSPYRPNSPYAASKAAADHFVHAYHQTYDLSVTISHATNTYGPHQYRDQFIPKMIYGCMREEPLPVYGNGVHMRDWIHVEDHVKAIWQILERGKCGEAYNVGGSHEVRSIDLLHQLIDSFARVSNEPSLKYRSLITYVKDRGCHDFRFAIDAQKLHNLGWKVAHPFAEGLETTIEWYKNVWK